MIGAGPDRLRWEELPAHVRAAVDGIIGDSVVAAVSQWGGYSPGTADRVTTSGGQRAFVKAVSATLNPGSVALHRREIEITAALPADAPAPKLIGSFDDDEWVAIVLEDIAGRAPAIPWQRAELDAVLAAAKALAQQMTPAPIIGLTSAAQELAEDFLGWRNIHADPPLDLDPWARRNLDLLVELADRGIRSLDGTTLCHTDLRVDNVLLRADDSVVFVDWPWASAGPHWFDTLLILLNVQLYGGHDVETLLREHCAAPRSDVDGVLAGLAGFFADNARRPDPPGLPTLRAFQGAQARAALAWLQARVADRSTV